MRARHLVRFLFGAIAAAGFAASSFAAQDRAVGPAPDGPAQGGLVRNILVTTTPGLLYAAIEGAGVYKSVDYGANWTSANNGLTDRRVRAIGGSPSGVMYAVTRGGAGFYRSVDGGTTWAASNSGLGCTFINTFTTAGSKLIVGGAGGACGNTGIQASSNSGIYWSSDSGVSWAPMGAAVPAPSTQIVALQGSADGTRIRAGGAGGVYISSNSGLSFSQSNGNLVFPLAPNSSDVPNIRFQSGSPTRLLAMVEGNGIWWTTNTDGGAGTAWTQASGLPANASTGAFLSLGTTNLYTTVDGGGFYMSTNGGASWSATTFTGLTGVVGTRGFFLNTAVDTNYYAATNAGVYKSTDSGASWFKSSSGLPEGNIGNMAGGSSTVYAAADTVYKSTDGGFTWTKSATGLAGTMNAGLQYPRGFVIPDSSSPTTVYATTVNKGIYKSTDAGATWTPINAGLPSNLAGEGPGIAIAQSSPSTLYAALTGNSRGVYKSTDGGVSWFLRSTGLTGNAMNVRAITVDPTDADKVYASTGAGLYRSLNGGASWELATPARNTSIGVGRSDLSGDGQDMLLVIQHTDARDRAYPTSGVYFSRDRGDTWRQLVSNEKVGTARLVHSGSGPNSTLDVWVSSFGYFDEYGTEDAYLWRCRNVYDFENPEQACTPIFIPEKPIAGSAGTRGGYVNSIAAGPVGSAAVSGFATSMGVYRRMNQFLGPDFNDDGRADILYRNTSTGSNAIWLMDGINFLAQGEGDPTTGSFRAVTGPWIVAGTGDFNGDGITDILWRNTSTGENYIYGMDRFTIAYEGFIRSVPAAWTVAGIGDFDGDGKSDILWRNSSTGENYLYPMDGLTILGTEGFVRTVSAPWIVAGVGDFTGDGRSDILWRNTSTGENYVYPMNGRTVLAGEGYIRSVPIAWSVKGLGDFNQDGRSDIVWRNDTTGEIYVYPMDGLTVLPGEGYLPTVADVTNWHIAAIGDFGGPREEDGIPVGRSDILWRNSSTGAAYVWRMTGTTTVAPMATCGGVSCQSGYLPLVTDTNWTIIGK